jgi:hypothetical protein
MTGLGAPSWNGYEASCPRAMLMTIATTAFLDRQYDFDLELN